MELKVILMIDNQIQIRNVEIVSEEANAYFIKCEGIRCSFVRKDALYKEMNGLIFGFDREELIKSWNKHIEREIEFTEAKLNKMRKCIVQGEFKEDIYVLY